MRSVPRSLLNLPQKIVDAWHTRSTVTIERMDMGPGTGILFHLNALAKSTIIDP